MRWYLAANTQGIFISFPMFLFPISLSLMSSDLGRKIFGEDGMTTQWKYTLVRCLLCVLCFFFAMTGINIMDVISVAGAVFNSFSAIVFPVGVEL